MRFSVLMMSVLTVFFADHGFCFGQTQNSESSGVLKSHLDNTKLTHREFLGSIACAPGFPPVVNDEYAYLDGNDHKWNISDDVAGRCGFNANKIDGQIISGVLVLMPFDSQLIKKSLASDHIVPVSSGRYSYVDISAGTIWSRLYGEIHVSQSTKGSFDLYKTSRGWSTGRFYTQHESLRVGRFFLPAAAGSGLFDGISWNVGSALPAYVVNKDVVLGADTELTIEGEGGIIRRLNAGPGLYSVEELLSLEPGLRLRANGNIIAHSEAESQSDYGFLVGNFRSHINRPGFPVIGITGSLINHKQLRLSVTGGVGIGAIHANGSALGGYLHYRIWGRVTRDEKYISAITSIPFRPRGGINTSLSAGYALKHIKSQDIENGYSSIFATLSVNKGGGHGFITVSRNQSIFANEKNRMTHASVAAGYRFPLVCRGCHISIEAVKSNTKKTSVIMQMQIPIYDRIKASVITNGNRLESRINVNEPWDENHVSIWSGGAINAKTVLGPVSISASYAKGQGVDVSLSGRFVAHGGDIYFSRSRNSAPADSYTDEGNVAFVKIWGPPHADVFINSQHAGKINQSGFIVTQVGKFALIRIDDTESEYVLTEEMTRKYSFAGGSFYEIKFDYQKIE